MRNDPHGRRHGRTALSMSTESSQPPLSPLSRRLPLRGSSCPLEVRQVDCSSSGRSVIRGCGADCIRSIAPSSSRGDRSDRVNGARLPPCTRSCGCARRASSHVAALCAQGISTDRGGSASGSNSRTPRLVIAGKGAPLVLERHIRSEDSEECCSGSADRCRCPGLRRVLRARDQGLGTSLLDAMACVSRLSPPPRGIPEVIEYGLPYFSAAQRLAMRPHLRCPIALRRHSVKLLATVRERSAPTRMCSNAARLPPLTRTPPASQTHRGVVTDARVHRENRAKTPYLPRPPCKELLHTCPRTTGARGETGAAARTPRGHSS